MKRKVHFPGTILFIAVFLVANIAFSQTRNILRDGDQAPLIINGLTPNLLPSVSSPKDAILSESFDAETFPPDGWTTANPDGGTGWIRVSVGTSPIPGWNGGTVTSPFTGGGVAFCTYSTGGIASNDQYLISPQLSITSDLALDFWLQKQPDSYMDSVQVLLSTTNNQPSSFTTVLGDYPLPWYTGESDWKHHTIDLSAFTGQNVYIAFREFSASNYYTAAVFIDQVTVGPLPTTPVAYVNYTAVDFGLVDAGQTNTYDVFSLLNFGGGILTASSVTFSNPVFSSSFDIDSVALATDESYHFSITYTPTATGFDEGTMTIVTNGGTIEISLYGEGYLMPEGMIQIGYEQNGYIGLPMDPSWPYTYSQVVYKQSDLNTSGKRITKVLYHYFHNSATPQDPYTENIVIYMGHTSLDTLSEWIPITNFVEVYNGTITCPGTGEVWIELELTFPFVYNNLDNLVIAFDENSPGNPSYDDFFFCSNTNGPTNLRKRADMDIDPANPLSLISVNLSPYYPNIRLQFEDLGPDPILVITPSTLDFEYQAINSTSEREVIFSNFGGTDLHITGFNGMAAPFSGINPVITVGPGAQSEPTTIYFSPTATGTYNQTVTVTSDAVGGSNVLNLTGYCFPDPYIHNFPYVMGFEGNDFVFPAYGWSNETTGTQANGNGTPIPWQQGLIPYSGAFSAGVANYYILDYVEAVMTTPYINLPAAHRISFWWADNNNSFVEGKSPKSPLLVGYDTTFFEASLNHGQSWETLAFISAESPEQYHKQWIDLADYVSDSLLLRWRDVIHNADFYATLGVALDEIVIEYNNPNPLITLNNNIWEAGLVLPNTTKESGLVYTIQNIEGGILTVTSVSGLEGTDFATTLVPGDVTLGLGETYSFGFSYSPATIGVDNAVFQLVTSGGTVSITLSGEAVEIGEFTSESFDGETFPPLGWLSIDADGDNWNWMRQADPTTYAYSTHSGIGAAYSESFSLAGGVLYPDNYLITPAFTVSDLKNEFVWWVSPHGLPGMENDHYSVSISTGGTNPSDFIELFSEDIQFQDWNLRTVILNAYMGQEVRMAIRHFWSYDKWQVKIDDVAVIPEGTVSNNDPDAEKMLTVYPNPANDFINISATEPVKQISLYNTLGALVDVQQVNTTFCRLNTAKLDEGLYILRAETAKGVFTKRMSIVR